MGHFAPPSAVVVTAAGGGRTSERSRKGNVRGRGADGRPSASVVRDGVAPDAARSGGSAAAAPRTGAGTGRMDTQRSPPRAGARPARRALASATPAGAAGVAAGPAARERRLERPRAPPPLR